MGTYFTSASTGSDQSMFVSTMADKSPTLEHTQPSLGIGDFKNFLENHVRTQIHYDLAVLGIGVYHKNTCSGLPYKNFHTGFIQLILGDNPETKLSTDYKSVLYVDIEKGVRLNPIKQLVTQHLCSDPSDNHKPAQTLELLKLQKLSDKNRFNNQLYAEFILLKTHSPVTELNKHSANKLEPVLREKLFKFLNSEIRQQNLIYTLTLREKEILGGINQGLSNKLIGSKLAISEFTVKNHVRRIQKKLNADNRAHALAIALSEGLDLDAGG